MQLRKMVLALALAVAGGLGLAGLGSQDVMAVTCPDGSLRAGATNVSTYADCNIDPNEKTDLMDKSTVIINVIVSIVGIISVAVIVIGGITFATSQGDTAKTTKAKNTILYGIVGLIIALLAFAIVNFVLKSVF